MPGRGRGSFSKEGLRQPGNRANVKKSFSQDIVSRVSNVSSPDDLNIQTLATEIKSNIKEENDLRELVDELCNKSLNSRDATSVIGAICGQLAHFQVGESKFRNLLLKKVQKVYSEKDSLDASDRSKFVTSAMFLGEIFYNLKSENGSHFKVLVEPVITYLSMILRPNLSSKPSPSINEEMMVVAKLMHQNTSLLHTFDAKGLEDIVCLITEIMIRHPLNQDCRLNLLAVLAELWSKVQPSVNPITTHATLATKLGLSLKI